MRSPSPVSVTSWPRSRRSSERVWRTAAQSQCGVECGCIGNTGLPSGWRRLGLPPLDGASDTADRATLVSLASVVLPLRTALNSFWATFFLKAWSPPCGNDLHASSRTTSRLAAVRSSRCVIPLSEGALTGKQPNHGTSMEIGMNSGPWIAGITTGHHGGEMQVCAERTRAMLALPLKVDIKAADGHVR